MSTPSALVADRYRLVRMLGAGGMGIVWQAWDERLHRPVALKLLRTQPELTEAERQQSTDRAMREARIAAGLHHPHVVTVFDVVEHEGQPCIVMQLVESTPLSELLREHGPFTPAQTAAIGAQVASALAAAHTLKIVHRDVKPGNVLITADGSAMISDFGISHALGDATITATGLIHGTPAYLAPEVARGLPTSFASDVFSLGSTLYAMIEGEPPFGTDRNSIALLHRVARGGFAAPKRAGPLAPLLRAMLSPQPKRRPSMSSVVEELSGMPGAPVAVPAPDSADRADAQTLRETPTPGIIQLDPPTRPAGTAVPPAGTAALPPAAGPPAPVVGPADLTQPMEQATRSHPPTAETEPLGGGPVAGAALSGGDDTTYVRSEEPPRRRRTRPVLIALLLILLVGAGIVATVLLNPNANRVEDGRAPADQTTSSTAPTESAPPEDEAPAPSSPQEDEEEEPAPPPVTAEQRVVDSISGYYAMMPAQRDAAWPLMTADYQENHAGGRGGYDAFWSEIADVTVADVTATSPDSGQATLTYYFTDGSVTQEVTAFRFVDEGGVLKIAETEVLSSRSL